MERSDLRYIKRRQDYLHNPTAKVATKGKKRRKLFDLFDTDPIDDVKKLIENDKRKLKVIKFDDEKEYSSDEEEEEYSKDEADVFYNSIFDKKNPIDITNNGHVDEMIKKIKGKEVEETEEEDSIIDTTDDGSRSNNTKVPIYKEGENKLTDLLKNDEILVKRTEMKYARKQFKPNLYTKSELLSKMQPYYELIPKILKGELDSYFYNVLNGYMKRSKHEMIQISEYQQLPLSILQCGYLGKKRSMIIQQKIYLKFLPLLQNMRSRDKLMKWLGVDDFIRFVLLPELCSYFIRDEFQLSNVDKSIDLMELTLDYGLYIMDKINAKEEEYDSEVEDDEEMRGNRKKMNIVGNGDNEQEEDDKFVENLIGIVDSEDEDEDESIV